MLPRYTIFALLAVAACQRDRTVSRSLEPTFSKGRPDTNPRAVLSFAESVYVSDSGRLVVAGIRGDGRLKNGAVSGTASNEYEGDWCGVYATIEGASDLDLDPDVGYSATMSSACGPKRAYAFYLAGPSSPPTASGPHSISRGMATLAVGQSVTRAEGFGIQLANCQRVMFDSQYAPSTSARQTRLPDVFDAAGRSVRRWRIESQGTHRAMCLMAGKGTSFVPTGVTYFLPFAITVVEVPYPYSVYP